MGSNHRNLFLDRAARHLRVNFLNIGVIITVISTYTINTFIGKPNFNSQFLHCYLNDLIAMPLILAYTNLLTRWLGRRPPVVTTPIRIGCLTIFCVIVWEGFAPMLLARSTRDPWDVVVYSIGSCCYFTLVFVSDRRNFCLSRNAN